jgi:hypothetical protein
LHAKQKRYEEEWDKHQQPPYASEYMHTKASIDKILGRIGGIVPAVSSLFLSWGGKQPYKGYDDESGETCKGDEKPPPNAEPEKFKGLTCWIRVRRGDGSQAS